MRIRYWSSDVCSSDLIHRGCYGTWLSVDMILATTEPSRRRPLTIHSSRNYFVPAKCGTKSVPHFASTTQFGLIQALGRMDTIAANGRMRKREDRKSTRLNSSH